MGEKPVEDAILSPAGDRIVYREGERGSGGVHELFKNGDARSLVGDDGRRSYGAPRFSPQGTYLLLDVRQASDGRTRGIEVRRVTDGRVLVQHNASSATWGPSGERLAVVHPYVGVMVISFPDGKVEHFIPVESQSPSAYPRATFSPNGEMIAVVDYPSANGARLRCVELATDREATMLSSSEGIEIRPFFSPDNVHLGAFLRAREEGQNASTIAVWDLTEPKSLPRSVYASSGLDPIHTPVFSPSGKEIVLIHRDVRSGRTDVFAMPVAGGRPTRLTELGNVQGSPRWAGGKRLVIEGGRRIYVVGR